MASTATQQLSSPSTVQQSVQTEAPDQIQLLLCAERVIGRAPGANGVVLLSSTFPGMISRRHASIRYRQSTSQWLIKDLESLNGIFLNGKRIECNEDTVISNGDIIIFGLNTDQNELLYIFNSQAQALNRLVGGANLSRAKRTNVRVSRSKKRQRSPPDPVALMTTPPSDYLPTLGGGKRVAKRQKSETPPMNGNSSPPSPTILTEEIFISPPSRKTFTIDSLFDTSQCETTTKMEEAIFGETPPLTPRARAVLSGAKISAAEIQVQIARDEVEREKQKIESKYEVLKNELADKEKKLQEKSKKEEEISEAIESELVCAICQELLIRTITLGCSHSFCEWCMKQWREKRGKGECPICREPIRQKPIRSLAIDHVIQHHIQLGIMTTAQKIQRREIERVHHIALGFAPPPPLDQPAGSAKEPILVVDSSSPASVTAISDYDNN